MAPFDAIACIPDMIRHFKINICGNINYDEGIRDFYHTADLLEIMKMSIHCVANSL